MNEEVPDDESKSGELSTLKLIISISAYWLLVCVLLDRFCCMSELNSIFLNLNLCYPSRALTPTIILKYLVKSKLFVLVSVFEIDARLLCCPKLSTIAVVAVSIRSDWLIVG